MSEFTWKTSSIYDLITQYHERPVLWDTDSEDYRDRSKKATAWQEIAEFFGVNRLVVERKIKILVAQYRRELQRCFKGETSKWYAFKRLSFLKAATTARAHDGEGGVLSQAQQANLSKFECEEEVSDEEDVYPSEAKIKRHTASSPVTAWSPQIVASVSTAKIPQQVPSVDLVTAQLSRKRRQSFECDVAFREKPRSLESDSTQQLLKVICNELQKSRDEYSLFGEYVANKLRSIDDRRVVSIVQYHINNVLFEAAMGKYDGGQYDKRAEDTRAGTQTTQTLRQGMDDYLATESSGDSSRVLEVQIKNELDTS